MLLATAIVLRRDGNTIGWLLPFGKSWSGSTTTRVTKGAQL